jgi:hypothetical protein
MAWQRSHAARGRRRSSPPTCWPICSGGERLLTDVASSPIAAGEARAAARTRGQTSGAPVPTMYAGDGSRQNHPRMDSKGSALLPLAAGFRLRGSQARWGALSCRAVIGEGTSRRAQMEPTLGSEGLSITKNRPKVGLERAGRFLHHLQWQHRSLAELDFCSRYIESVAIDGGGCGLASAFWVALCSCIPSPVVCADRLSNGCVDMSCSFQPAWALLLVAGTSSPEAVLGFSGSASRSRPTPARAVHTSALCLSRSWATHRTRRQPGT